MAARYLLLGIRKGILPLVERRHPDLLERMRPWLAAPLSPAPARQRKKS